LKSLQGNSHGNPDSLLQGLGDGIIINPDGVNEPTFENPQVVPLQVKKVRPFLQVLPEVEVLGQQV